MYELLLLYYDNMQMLLNLGWKDSLFVNANKKKKIMYYSVFNAFTHHNVVKSTKRIHLS